MRSYENQYEILIIILSVMFVIGWVIYILINYFEKGTVGDSKILSRLYEDSNITKKWIGKRILAGGFMVIAVLAIICFMMAKNYLSLILAVAAALSSWKVLNSTE